MNHETGTDDWKWDNAGVVLMYRGNVYTFWHDSQQEKEKNLYRCLEAICPIRIVIPNKEDKPHTKAIRVK